MKRIQRHELQTLIGYWATKFWMPKVLAKALQRHEHSSDQRDNETDRRTALHFTTSTAEPELTVRLPVEGNVLWDGGVETLPIADV
jgi:hypothetical protein